MGTYWCIICVELNQKPWIWYLQNAPACLQYILSVTHGCQTLSVLLVERPHDPPILHFIPHLSPHSTPPTSWRNEFRLDIIVFPWPFNQDGVLSSLSEAPCSGTADSMVESSQDGGQQGLRQGFPEGRGLLILSQWALPMGFLVENIPLGVDARTSEDRQLHSFLDSCCARVQPFHSRVPAD